MAPGKRLPASVSARARGPDRGDDALRIERGFQAHDAAEFEIAAKQHPDEFGFRLDNVQRPVFDPVAERDHPAHPNPLLLRGGDLLTDPLARNLAFELGEGQQHVEGQTAHARGGVELLCVTETKDTLLASKFRPIWQVGQRTGEAVDL